MAEKLYTVLEMSRELGVTKSFLSTLMGKIGKPPCVKKVGYTHYYSEEVFTAIKNYKQRKARCIDEAAFFHSCKKTPKEACDCVFLKNDEICSKDNGICRYVYEAERPYHDR